MLDAGLRRNSAGRSRRADVQSAVYDLAYGSAAIRPDSAMGYDACENALSGNFPISGNVGAGTGATVGKICGMKQSTKSGVGYYAVQVMAKAIENAILSSIMDDAEYLPNCLVY